MTLRERREALGLSQEQIAEAAGLRQGVISSYERGASPNPTVNTLHALSRAYRLSVPEVIAAVRETVEAVA